jgi:Iron-sulfur cluster-binding domain/DGC domain/Thioredoxin domain
MDIKILGPACVNCLKLGLLVAQALKEIDLEAKIGKIVEDKKISKYRGDPPILLVEGQMVHAGLPLPSLDEIKGFILQRIPPVMGKTKAAQKVVTVDGCPFECCRKMVEEAGFKATKSIVLVRDIGMKKCDRCPFIDRGATAIAWDGSLTPCLPLLHNHISFLDDRERESKRYVVGNVAARDLGDLWNDPEYIAFRDRVQRFDFSPCTSCGGCDFSEKNEEDCFGNAFPTCGGCLSAQGVIQCP